MAKVLFRWILHLGVKVQLRGMINTSTFYLLYCNCSFDFVPFEKRSRTFMLVLHTAEKDKKRIFPSHHRDPLVSNYLPFNLICYKSHTELFLIFFFFVTKLWHDYLSEEQSCDTNLVLTLNLLKSNLKKLNNNRDGRLGSKVVRLATNGINLELFHIRFQYILSKVPDLSYLGLI